MHDELMDRVLRLALLATVLPGCLFFGGRGGSGGGSEGDDIVGDDAPDPSCPPHSATIFEPGDGAVVPRTFDARVRWNEPSTPDRYTSMTDGSGNFFTSSGPDEVLADGSIKMSFTLPGNDRFHFEIGWICDAGSGGGRQVPLATSIIFTVQ
jgi:hypothetical protein